MNTQPWKKWTQNGNFFPKNKYSFSEYLKKVGDFIETYPMSVEDAERIHNAAHHWAWVQNVRIKTNKIKVEEDKRVVRITLTHKIRRREDIPWIKS